MSSKLILVTGGTGFLGKEIVNCLIENGFKARVLTRDNTSYKDTEFVEYFSGDILNKESLKDSISGCYGIIHAAGEKSNSSKMELINVTGTKNVCDVSMSSDIKYFCFVSSVGVIGLNSNVLIDENSTCEPTNTYEKTKLDAEKYFVSHFKKNDCSSFALRPTNIFGLKHVTFSNSIPSKLKRWMKGNEVANYVYVKDVAAASVYFLSIEKTLENEIFIVNQQSKKYLFKDVYKTVNTKNALFYPSIYLPWFFRYIKNGKNNVGNKFYSTKKINDFGFKNLYGLEKGIKDVLK